MGKEPFWSGLPIAPICGCVSVVRRVEFQHQRLHGDGLQVSLPGAANLAVGLRRRIVAVRSVVLLLGSLGLAFATQRSGLSLGGALCLFLGTLPVLWVMGSFAGALLNARRMVASAERLQGSATRSIEHVTLELTDTHLRVRRVVGEATHDIAFALRDVRMHRLGTDVLIVTLTQGTTLEHLQVPVSAFLNSGEFDAFCLELQGALWSSERRA